MLSQLSPPNASQSTTLLTHSRPPNPAPLMHRVPSAWSAFSKLFLWLVPFLSFKPQLTCQLPSKISSTASPPAPIITAPCLFPARHPPSTSNLHLFHLPVYSLVYCLSSSTSANYMEVLSVCSSLDPQAPSPGSSKNKCLFSEQMPETMRRHFTCIISKAETIVPIQQTEEIVFLLLR